MPIKQYQVFKIDTSDVLTLIPKFNDLGPGIRYGVDRDAHLQQWLRIGQHCYGYSVCYGRACIGFIAVYKDFSPDPHFKHRMLAQVALTVVRKGCAGALSKLIKFMQQDLRSMGVEAVVISRQISETEVRSKLHKL